MLTKSEIEAVETANNIYFETRLDGSYYRNDVQSGIVRELLLIILKLRSPIIIPSEFHETDNYRGRMATINDGEDTRRCEDGRVIVEVGHRSDYSGEKHSATGR